MADPRVTKSCPFCSRTKIHGELVEIVQPGGSPSKWCVECGSCLARGPLNTSYQHAVNAWNGDSLQTHVEPPAYARTPMPPPPVTPTPGRIVLYWRESLPGKPLPAIIIEWDAQKKLALLCAFSSTGTRTAEKVPYADEPGESDCWTWPKRA